MVKLRKTNNYIEKNMITVRLKLKDDKYYQLADEAFFKANMKKEDIGLYVGDENTFVSSFLALRLLIKNHEFVKQIELFTRDCGDSDGEEDLMTDYYKYMLETGRINA